LRTNVEFDHRLHAAWARFHKYRYSIFNKHVSLKLKLWFFDSVVPPTAMFGLAVLTLTKLQIHISAAKDATLHCRMGPYTQRTMARYDTKNER
jgi:hypothetical protein